MVPASAWSKATNAAAGQQHRETVAPAATAGAALAAGTRQAADSQPGERGQPALVSVIWS